MVCIVCLGLGYVCLYGLCIACVCMCGCIVCGVCGVCIVVVCM